MSRPLDTDACIDVIERVTDYLEGALTADQARRLERHVERCPGCSEYLDQMRTIAGSLEGLREGSLPADLRAGLIATFRDLRNAWPARRN